MTTVLVAGSGPAGLALACGLRQQGVSVRVVDRAPGPATTSRANFVHARGSEVLDRLGALGTLPEQALHAITVTTYAGDRPVMKVRFGDTGLRTAAPPMMISQASVEAALRDRLAELGVSTEWGTEVVGAEQDADGVTVGLAGGETTRVAWLAGCDGSGSTVRGLADIPFPGVRISERFLLADLEIDWDIDRDGTSGWLHPDGLFAAMPMPGDRWRLFAYDPGQPGARPSEVEIVDRLARYLRERTGRDARFGRCNWASVFSVHRRLAEHYRRGRILLAGDAAHVHSPFGGQGMLTGLGDAENLAWKLASVAGGYADEALLDTYEAERRPLAEDVLRATTAVTRINIASTPFGRFLRDKVLVRLGNLPLVQRTATYSASQLGVSYRKGPLGGRRPIGDRVPDLPCTRDDGSGTRLHAELRGGWALLLPRGGHGEHAETAAKLLGPGLVTLHRVDDEPRALLVRPDGHAAWRDDTDLGETLAALLRGGRPR
ncbi:FAD-dependent monooxygenase [Amycolatopsis suaedae]|uniref:Oxygenase n=1 Tax=Amycolatopsis suaedae TaxID=2510978 RepID=A0A4Q7J8V9_9PSEU|nr:FAD-dependent monooxygenase [Amycolatopsis suaedae]RZQ63428.1 oxygenase [Amycolatopsis suaedae]